MNKSNLLIGIHERPKSKLQWGVLSLQHVFAMFGATVLVPILTGLSISVALFASGIGTLIYIALTKAKVPVYLGSSFAYIAAISIASQSFGPEAAFIGLMVVGLIYVLVALGIRFAGKAWLDKILPPVVIGPMIAIIGISLASVATGQAGLSPTSGNDYFAFLATDPMNAVIAIVAFTATVVLAVFAKGFFKIVPIIGGIVIGYVFALVTGNVDFSVLEAFNLSDSLSIPFLYFAAIISVLSVAGIVTLLLSEKFSNKNSIIKIVIGVYLLSLFIGYALSAILTGGQIFAIPDFTFLGTYAIDFRAVAMFAPIAFVTIAEHIGDHKILGSITGKDFLKDPGLDRTLLGDGVATFVSAALGGPANTTYGENTGVVGMTKVASVWVIGGAAVISIILSFFSIFTALVATIPTPVMGGVLILLFGLIAGNGLKVMVDARVNLASMRNLIVVSTMLVVGLGEASIKLNDASSLTGMALAVIVGIILNLVLPQDKKEPNSLEELFEGYVASEPPYKSELVLEEEITAKPVNSKPKTTKPKSTSTKK